MESILFYFRIHFAIKITKTDTVCRTMAPSVSEFSDFLYMTTAEYSVNDKKVSWQRAFLCSIFSTKWISEIYQTGNISKIYISITTNFIGLSKFEYEKIHLYHEMTSLDIGLTDRNTVKSLNFTRVYYFVVFPWSGIIQSFKFFSRTGESQLQ